MKGRTRYLVAFFLVVVGFRASEYFYLQMPTRWRHIGV